jgi:peptidoglycan/LPS O-acetylase OafA/YrhL
MWPVTHLPIFIYGILLSRVHRFWRPVERTQFWMAIAGVVLLFAAYESGERLPYLYAHNGLLAPISSLLILGMAGKHWLSRIFSWNFLVRFGMASYALYLLHFNTWIWLHHAPFMQHGILQRCDPWLSYSLIAAIAFAASVWVEKPVRRMMERMLGVPSSRNVETRSHTVAGVAAQGLS